MGKGCGGPPDEIKEVVMRTEGGIVAPASALAPKIGPLGLSPKKVGEDICKATKGINWAHNMLILKANPPISYGCRMCKQPLKAFLS